MRLIGFLFKTLFWLFLLGAVAVVALLLTVPESTPLVTASEQLTRSDITRARLLLRQHDPRLQRAGQTRTLRLSERELNLLANYFLASLGEGAAGVVLGDGNGYMDATLRLPPNPLGEYLNLHLALTQSSAKAVISELRLGSVRVPQPVAQRLVPWLIRVGLNSRIMDNAGENVERFVLNRKQLVLTYQWDPRLVDQMRESLLTEGERHRLGKAWGHLSVAVQSLPQTRLDLHQLLGAMFREMDAGGAQDPVAANRASILVLAAYVNGSTLRPIVGEDFNLPKVRRLPVKLRGRSDLAKHFVVSAALNVSGGGPLSQLLGLHKELSDARGGSGFSFPDLAADMAGNRFAEVLTGSASLARRSQQLLAQGVDEEAIMPSIHGLPEGLQERDFKHRYGSSETPAYKREVEKIQRRIDACSLYEN